MYTGAIDFSGTLAGLAGESKVDSNKVDDAFAEMDKAIKDMKAEEKPNIAFESLESPSTPKPDPVLTEAQKLELVKQTEAEIFKIKLQKWLMYAGVLAVVYILFVRNKDKK